MDPEEVAPLSPTDRAAAAAAATLLNRELGAGLYRAEWLLEDAADPAAHVWLAPPAQPAGAAVARLLGAGDRAYYRAFGRAAVDLFTGPVGSLEALAVEPGRRRRGLGGKLAATALDWLRARRSVAIVTLSWLSGREGSSAGLFRRLGMHEGPTVARFYFEESVRDGWMCPVCLGPCTCSATLFTLRVTR